MNGSPLPAPALLRSLAAALIVCTMAHEGRAQVTIMDGFSVTCSGTLYDSGGQGGTGYGPNETWDMTLCAETPGSAIRLDWTTFNLGPGATIEVFDGFDATAYSFGVLNSGIGGVPVQSSYANVMTNGQGCLFLRFISGPAAGNFTASISCFTPCAAPTAAATFGSPNPLRVCQGEPVSFDGSASTAVDPFTITEYRWDFADSTQDTSGPVVTHAFDNPGEYIVQLYVTDDNSCTNENRVDLQVFVSTTPSFAGSYITPLSICEGEQVNVTAVPQAVTWSALPSVNLGNGETLPDGSGVTYGSQLTYSQFAPGARLSNPEDLQAICVSMEHSYMGDLIIMVTCPSGQTLIMHDQGGTDTYIGAANDTDEAGDPVIGECWNYCWSPTATLGTWAESASGGSSENVVTAGTPPLDALAPGTYSSVEPWSNLAGCELNGTWTFAIRDMLFQDNGFLCDWSLDFNPQLFPSLTQFTPILGVSTPDSANWQGHGFVPDPQDPLVGVATPMGVGTHDYVFHVTDDFGCTYDTTITVTVAPGIEGPITITGEGSICAGTTTALAAPAGYSSYTWSNNATGQQINAAPGTYTVAVSNGTCSLTSDPYTVAAQPSPAPVIVGPPFSCGGGAASLTTSEQYETYAWSNGDTTPTTTTGSGPQTVTVTNSIGCSGTSPVFNVVLGSDPQAAFSTTPASPQAIGTTVAFTDQSQGNGSTLVTWHWSFGGMGATSTDPSPVITFDEPGDHPVTLTVTAADGCEHTITRTYHILPEQLVFPNVFTPNGDGKNEFFEIGNAEFHQNTFAVFNRWGQKVYEAENYRNTWRAMDIPDGTYYYVFTTKRDGKEHTGHVTIVR